MPDVRTAVKAGVAAFSLSPVLRGEGSEKHCRFHKSHLVRHPYAYHLLFHAEHSGILAALLKGNATDV